jgi:glucokinase
MSASYGIGIDLGGTRIKSARFDLTTGELLATAMVPTQDGEQAGDIPAFAAGVRELVHRHEREMGFAAEAVGISAPGLAARDGSCIEFMPGKLAGLQNLRWSELLSRPATCLNDAHAALMGEVWQGAAKERADVAMLTLGTGVGGAVVSGGRLLRGHIGRAGHLGHTSVNMDGPQDICNTPGSVEYEIGNGYLEARSAGQFQMTRDLLSAVEIGDSGAIQLWERSVKALAVTIVSVINSFDPELILIGGGVANAWADLEGRLKPHLDRYEWRPAGHRVPVVRATLGEWSGCYGAVWNEMQRTHT